MREVIEKLERMVKEKQVDLQDFKAMMTAEEQTIVNVLEANLRAMNVNEIRNAIIDDFIRLLKRYEPLYKVVKELELLQKSKRGEKKSKFVVKDWEERRNGKIEELKEQLENLRRQLRWFTFSYWVGEVDSDEELILKAIEELEKIGVWKKGVIKDRDKRKVAEVINRCKIARIPSFKTIERILENLELSGIVISREDVKGKGKRLFALNPLLLRT